MTVSALDDKTKCAALFTDLSNCGYTRMKMSSLADCKICVAAGLFRLLLHSSKICFLRDQCKLMNQSIISNQIEENYNIIVL